MHTVSSSPIYTTHPSCIYVFNCNFLNAYVFLHVFLLYFFVDWDISVTQPLRNTLITWANMLANQKAELVENIRNFHDNVETQLETAYMEHRQNCINCLMQDCTCDSD